MSFAQQTTLLKKQSFANQGIGGGPLVESEFGAFNYTSISEYRMGRTLGQGAYAVVKEGQHKNTGQMLAIKVYDKYKMVDIQKKRSAIREIKILKKMDHENVVMLYDAIDTQRQLYLVMENCEGQCLQHLIKSRLSRKISEEEAIPIFTQLMQGMAYIHSKNVAHRDIKLENILYEVSKNKLKIIDFGFCCFA